MIRIIFGFVIFLLIFISVMQFMSDLSTPENHKDAAIQDTITRGVGINSIVIDADRSTVEEELDPPDTMTEKGGIFIADYPQKGIRIEYYKGNEKVKRIFFYNNDPQMQSFGLYRGKTSRGIDFQSTPEAVITAYGEPLRDKKPEESSYRQLGYRGIDFLFYQDKMVRISVTKPDYCDFSTLLITLCNITSGTSATN